MPHAESGLWCSPRALAGAPCLLVFAVQSLSHVRFFETPWTAGFPVLRSLPEFAGIHVHRIGDAIQPSHPLLPPSPPALSLSQHQSLFQ